MNLRSIHFRYVLYLYMFAHHVNITRDHHKKRLMSYDDVIILAVSYFRILIHKPTKTTYHRSLHISRSFAVGLNIRKKLLLWNKPIAPKDIFKNFETLKVLLVFLNG